MSGFATSPFAITPFGAGTPAVAVAPPENPPAGSRFINPLTRDYERATDGSFRRSPTVRHRLLLAVTTAFRSSSVLRDFGIRKPNKIGTGFAQQMTNAVELAAAHLVREGVMTLDGVTVVVQRPGRAQTTIAFTDLTTGNQDELVI